VTCDVVLTHKQLSKLFGDGRDYAARGHLLAKYECWCGVAALTRIAVCCTLLLQQSAAGA
jgi:hypothetical protein